MGDLEQLFGSFCTCCKNEKYHHTQDHKDFQCPIFNEAYISESRSSELSECENGNLICSAFCLHNWHDENGNLIEPQQKTEKNVNQLESF